MDYLLQYGFKSAVTLEFASTTIVGQFGRPAMSRLVDPEASAAEALANPLEYPSLARATTPGDRVTVALEPAVPCADQMVAAVVGALAIAGIAPDGVTVLRTATDERAGAGDPRPILPPSLAESIAVVTHHPAERERMAYLAAADNGEPILLHRAVVDADVVVPVGCIHNPSAAGFHGIYGAIYPTFSDERTQKRFHSPAALDVRGGPKSKVIERVDQVGWLLGAAMTMQVIPGAGDDLLHVLAGEAQAVSRRGHELYERAWGGTVSQRASLVIATIEGRQQTWDNLGRALAAAELLVEDDGAIVICCDLAGEPGPAVARLAAPGSREAALREIRKDRPDDAQAAAQLAQAQQRARVYLLSKLAPSLLEDLELAPVTDPDDIGRLARRHASCIVLANAPRTMVRLRDAS